MKKILAVILALTTVFIMTGCLDDLDGGYPRPDPGIRGTEAESFQYESFSRDLSEMIAENEVVGDGLYATARLIVSAKNKADLNGIGATDYIEAPGGAYILQFSGPEAAEQAAAKLAATSGVAYAEPDTLVSCEDFYSWGAMAMGADLFASTYYTQQVMTPVVAVIDSGVNSHEMIGPMLTGWDFVEGDSVCNDRHGHGTHVAGIVSDLMGDFSHRILPLRVLNENGKGSSVAVGAAIRYAADHGANVINLSLGGPHNSYKDEAVNYAVSKGCNVVVAAGNDTADASAKCPAHIPGAITVSAIDEDYQLADFSNFGYGIDMAAPGVGIISADHRGGYVAMNGTSMAAPHIAAILALIRASGAAGNATAAEQLLYECCLDIGQTGKDPYYGWGVPDCGRIAAKLRVGSVQPDHWILRANSANSRDLAKVVFRDDGTVEFVDIEGGWYAYGTYYYSSEQLTIECTEYLHGKEFFTYMGSGYVSSGSFLQEDSTYATYTLIHVS